MGIGPIGLAGNERDDEQGEVLRISKDDTVSVPGALTPCVQSVRTYVDDRFQRTQGRGDGRGQVELSRKGLQIRGIE